MVGVTMAFGLIAFAAAPAAIRSDYAAYAAPVYRGHVAHADFAHSPRSFRAFRTHISEGMRGPVNFGGNYVVMLWGCGAGCRTGVMGDARTGRIVDFPLGGEDYYMLDLHFRPNSRLIRATWEKLDGDRTTCIEQLLLWDGASFRRGPQHGRPGQCPE